MGKINAVITGVGGYVPDYILNNEELSRMVDTNDEWITTRVGIKERRILTEEGLGTASTINGRPPSGFGFQSIGCTFTPVNLPFFPKNSRELMFQRRVQPSS